MMRYGLLTIFLLLQTTGFAQKSRITGKVTYVSSQLVYIQFENTKGVLAGDTLYIEAGANTLKAAAMVKFISSRSLACELFPGITAPVGSAFIAYQQADVPKGEIKGLRDTSTQKQLPIAPVSKKAVSADAFNIKGRVTLQTSSDFSSESRYNSNRYRGSLNYTIENAFITGLQFTNYMTYSVRDKEWTTVKSSPLQNLRVYDFAAKFAIDSNQKVIIGRHLNYRLSGIGAIDGVQYEAGNSSLMYGVAVGSRPEFSDYSTNFKLFQAGAYIANAGKSTMGDYENSIAVFNQTNNFITDRRFLYIQHSNTFIPNTYCYLSNETELYEVVNGSGKTAFNFTGFYMMLRYTYSKEISTSLSYDARRNALYYETYKSFIQNMYSNHVRQGVRYTISYRPLPYVTINLNSGYRVQKGDSRPSQDYGSYVHYSGIPVIDADASAQLTYLNSTYLRGISSDFSISKLFFQEMYTQIGYRLFSSEYISTGSTYNQTTMYSSLSYPITNKVTATMYYEGVFEATGSMNRIHFDLSTRF